MAPTIPRSELRSAVLVAICLAILGCADRQPQSTSTPPNTILITVDTLRSDHLGAYGYFRDTSPHLDRFALDALVFENAIAPMATTLPSHVSIMTGSYPARHGIVSNFQFFETTWDSRKGLRSAVEMLRDAGYATAGFTSSSPLSAATGIAAGFDTFEGPPMISREHGRIDQHAGVAIDRANAWLAHAAAPFFLWVHLFDPHDPYRPPPRFRTLFSNEPALESHLERLTVPVELRDQASEWINQYDGEIRFVDEQIERLFMALKRLGLYETSNIVFTADHGEGLHQHGHPRHGGNWNEQLAVPLIVRLPNGPRGRLDTLASLIDIMPSLAGSGGLPLDRQQFDGIDLLRETREYALAQHEVRRKFPKPQLTLTSRTWKYWYFQDEPNRLYDLRVDPHETHNVVAEHLEVARGMRREVLRLLADNQERAPMAIRDGIPDALREQLRALGYVE